MSDTLERMPRTVTACHQEIEHLRAKLADQDDTDIDGLKDQIKDLEKENDELTERVEELETKEFPEAHEAINALLDECERVGPLRYDVAQTERASRAIVALHDVVGRNP